MKGFVAGCVILLAFAIFVVIKPLQQEAAADEKIFRQAKADFHREYPRVTIDEIRQLPYGGHQVVYHPVGAYSALCSAELHKVNNSYRINTAGLQPPCNQLVGNRKG
jgi:hypothetical protein